MAQAKAKRKVKARAKAARKAASAATTKVRHAAKAGKRTVPRRRRRSSTPSLAKEFGALADRITSFGKAVLERGTERAGEIAHAGITAIGHGGEKIGSEIAAIRRAAASRVKR